MECPVCHWFNTNHPDAYAKASEASVHDRASWFMLARITELETAASTTIQAPGTKEKSHDAEQEAEIRAYSKDE